MTQTPIPGWWRWTIVAAYMAAIFVASSGPGVALVPGRNSDKLMHAAAYAVLSALIAWAATRGRLQDTTRRVVLTAWLASAAYGVTDEVHQRFVPGRDADVFDVAADAIGAAAAAGALAAWSIIARGSK